MRAPSFSQLRRSPVRTLWIVTGALAVALAVLVLVQAIRGDDAPRGSDAAAYIADVNRTQGLSAGKLAQLNDAYADFGTPKGQTPAQLRRLAAGEQSLRELRAEVAAIEAPESALPLRRELLRVLDLQLAFAQDVTQFSRYLPKAAGAERSADAARVALLEALPQAKTSAAQADAFDTYSASAGKAANQLAALRAPAEFDTARKAEVARLRKLSEVAANSAEALREGRRADVEKAVDTFATESSSTVTAIRQREAALAYSRRLAEIERQQRRVQTAESELERSL